MYIVSLHISRAHVAFHTHTQTDTITHTLTHTHTHMNITRAGCLLTQWCVILCRSLSLSLSLARALSLFACVNVCLSGTEYTTFTLVVTDVGSIFSSGLFPIYILTLMHACAYTCTLVCMKHVRIHASY